MSAASFAEAARVLAGVSAWALGWRPDEFWRATPDELAASLSGPVPSSSAPPDTQAIAALRTMFPDPVETPDG
ncbi:phage tail assembly chaperone [Blastomonas fulva]|uniref:phage tail assembly chaperone n=1 Tax=Blastomonas fulva TaxID=1550728 RepID=UPI003F71B123